METNAFWTNIVEKVVNVKGLVLKELGNYLSFAIRVFWEENFYFQGIKDNLYPWRISKDFQHDLLSSNLLQIRIQTFFIKFFL